MNYNKALEVARVIVFWYRQVVAIMADRSLPYAARVIMVEWACHMARVSVRCVLAQAEYPSGGIVVQPKKGERVLSREDVENLLRGGRGG